MNRLNALFERKPKDVLSIFVTAGYPNLDSTVQTVLELEENGVDFIELGMPFSDPLADGPTIQQSSEVALNNGMNLNLLFEQVKEIRSKSEIPIVLMGYINPVLNFGLEKFLQNAEESGVDGLILPDISLEEYELNFRTTIEQYRVPLTFLMTPRTSKERIDRILSYTKTFAYFVSSASTTGKQKGYSDDQLNVFRQFNASSFEVPVMMGFGIHNAETFGVACEYFTGGIIGSAFIRSQAESQAVSEFLNGLRIPC